MIRVAAVSIWIAVLALISAYFGATVSFHSGKAPPPGEEGPAVITLKSLTVPVIANGAMQGYVLAQIALVIKRDLLKSLPQPPEVAVADFVFKTLYAEEQVDFKHLTKQDLKKLSTNILESVNASVGVPLVENVFIQELHYLNKQEAGVTVGPSPSPNPSAAAPHH